MRILNDDFTLCKARLPFLRRSTLPRPIPRLHKIPHRQKQRLRQGVPIEPEPPLALVGLSVNRITAAMISEHEKSDLQELVRQVRQL